MCTVVFIPINDTYYFASLRDENPARQQALLPTLISENKIKYLAPQDPLKGGTWAGVNEYGTTIILLNGAFEKHTKKNGYTKSRGLIVKELLTHHLPLVEWKLMDLAKIEPFTLIVWTDGMLFQLLWDGQLKHRISLSKHQAHIFSSSTLYDENAHKERKHLFDNWINAKPIITRSSLLWFLKSYPDAQNGFIINRDEKIKTLSYTFIATGPDGFAGMQYYDFASGFNDTSNIPFTRNEHTCLWQLINL